MKEQNTANKRKQVNLIRRKRKHNTHIYCDKCHQEETKLKHLNKESNSNKANNKTKKETHTHMRKYLHSLSILLHNRIESQTNTT